MTSRQERHQRRHERLTKAAESLVGKLGPKVTASGPVGDLNFAPDGPTCTGAQKGYVHQAVNAGLQQGILAGPPELTEALTIGQAEEILKALGANPDGLYRRGRDWGAAKEQRAWRATRAR